MLGKVQEILSDNTIATAKEDIKKKLAPLPEGYFVQEHQGGIMVASGNSRNDLAFFIPPNMIREEGYDVHIQDMYKKLLMAAPCKGTA